MFVAPIKIKLLDLPIVQQKELMRNGIQVGSSEFEFRGINHIEPLPPATQAIKVIGVLNSVNQAKQAKIKTRAILGCTKCTTTALEPGTGYTTQGSKVLNERYGLGKSTSARYISSRSTPA